MTDPTIKLTQCGQPRPYADSIFAGTVEAQSEEEARKKLASMRHTTEILDKQSPEEWSRPYFTSFRQAGPGEWAFRIVEEYTG
jgi:hypothetical protein